MSVSSVSTSVQQPLLQLLQKPQAQFSGAVGGDGDGDADDFGGPPDIDASSTHLVDIKA